MTYDYISTTLTEGGAYSIAESPVFGEVGDLEDVGGLFEDCVGAHTARTGNGGMH